MDQVRLSWKRILPVQDAVTHTFDTFAQRLQ